MAIYHFSTQSNAKFDLFRCDFFLAEHCVSVLEFQIQDKHFALTTYYIGWKKAVFKYFPDQ